VLEQRLNRRVLVFATPRPDSPPDSGEPSLAGVAINRPISPPGSGSESSEDEDTDNESGGALLEPPDEGKQRVLARSGKKVTPWATRASSFVSERPDSPDLEELRMEPEAVAVESESASDEEEEPGEPEQPASVEKLVPLIHRDTDGIRPPVEDEIMPLNPDAQEDDALAPLRARNIDSPPTMKPVTGRRSSAQTTSTIASGDEIFEDCPEIPFEEPPSSPSPVILTAKELSVAAAKARVRERLAPPPAAPAAATDDQKVAAPDDKKVILIFQPPDDPTPSQQQPPKPRLPALNIIPATPQALSSTAEKEKQLGHSQPLFSRRATGIPGSEDAIPEDDEATPLPPATRPSLAEVPEIVRQSKLHPWWRPKRPVEDGGELEHTLSAPSESGVSEEEQEQELKRRRASTAPNGKKNPNGRVVKRIKGTKFVIEFVGWRKILGKRRKAGDKEEK
jgi:hypothetical protein